jgi:hypothetical protein
MIASTQGFVTLCEKDSQTYHGPCSWSPGCDDDCRNNEKAFFGKCKGYHWGFPKCVCYFYFC